MKSIIGIIMMFLLVLAIFTLSAMDVGLMKALLYWGISIAVVAWIIIAVKLLVK